MLIGITVAALAGVAAAAPVSVEIATEPGLNVTAPQKWLQLFAEIGQTGVRIRGMRAGERPRLEELGGSRRVVGVLTRRGDLLLPGGKFRQRDRAALADYFDRVAKDGAEGVEAPRGRFDLTEKQFRTAYDALSEPLGFATKDQPPRAVVERVRDRLPIALEIDRAAERTLNNAGPLAEDLEPLTVGAALAVMLARDGLALTPEHPRGGEVRLRVAVAGDVADSWPVGYDPPASPRETAPVLFEFLSVEVEGFTLTEALDAITPRLGGLPVYWDHASIAEAGVDPASTQVRFERKRTYYKRLIDKLVFQARLKSRLRVDEAGTAFLWIGR
ncbi:hypothetical protein [Pseudobythopirellula maris]|nr:hypothetical protein [Pseudobythopirellula maris]